MLPSHSLPYFLPKQVYQEFSRGERNQVPTPEGDVQVETKLEIPVEDNKDVKSEAKSLCDKTTVFSSVGNSNRTPHNCFRVSAQSRIN